MVNRKTKQTYELYFLNVKDFSVSHYSGIDHRALKAANTYNDQIPVFGHSSTITFECECYYPESMDGIVFHVTAYGNDENKGLTVSDYVETDDAGAPVYTKRRGQRYPVHRLPNGVGSLEKVRGLPEWRAYCSLENATLVTMVSILSIDKPFYLSLDVLKLYRNRAIRAIDLQAEKPE